MIPEPPSHFDITRDVMERHARERAAAAALWWVPASGRLEQRTLFRPLPRSFRRAASFFHRVAIRRGNRVLVILPRVQQWWVAMLGVIRLGSLETVKEEP